MKRIMLAAVAVFSILTLTGLLSGHALAQVNVFPQCGDGTVDSQVCSGGGKLFGAGSIWNKILNAVTFVAGGIAVLMIIIGGLRYTLSSGDAGSAASAKNTVIYALVGLVLSVMANALVNFVLANI